MSTDGYELYVRASDLLKAGDLHAAKMLFQESYSGDPHPKTAHQLSSLHESLGELTEALEWAQIAYTTGPRMSEVSTNWAKWLARLNRQSEAIDLLTQVLRSNTTYRPARDLLNSLTSGGSLGSVHSVSPP